MSTTAPVFDVGEGDDRIVLRYLPDVSLTLASTIRAKEGFEGPIKGPIQTSFSGRFLSESANDLPPVGRLSESADR